MAKVNPDDRSDNVRKLQETVQNTIGNLEASHDTLQQEGLNEKDKKAIRDKNRRREESIKGLREEIKDEAEHRPKYH